LSTVSLLGPLHVFVLLKLKWTHCLSLFWYGVHVAQSLVFCVVSWWIRRVWRYQRGNQDRSCNNTMATRLIDWLIGVLTCWTLNTNQSINFVAIVLSVLFSLQLLSWLQLISSNSSYPPTLEKNVGIYIVHVY
jgi:hypothetical protein